MGLAGHFGRQRSFQENMGTKNKDIFYWVQTMVRAQQTHSSDEGQQVTNLRYSHWNLFPLFFFYLFSNEKFITRMYVRPFVNVTLMCLNMGVSFWLFQRVKILCSVAHYPTDADASSKCWTILGNFFQFKWCYVILLSCMLHSLFACFIIFLRSHRDTVPDYVAVESAH